MATKIKVLHAVQSRPNAKHTKSQGWRTKKGGRVSAWSFIGLFV